MDLDLSFGIAGGSALPCLVGATYLHFLVGGFWSVAALFYQWLARRQLKTTILTALTYLALSVPLAVGLLVDQLGGWWRGGLGSGHGLPLLYLRGSPTYSPLPA